MHVFVSFVNINKNDRHYAHNNETYAAQTIPVESIVNATQECMYNQEKVRDTKSNIDDEIVCAQVCFDARKDSIEYRKHSNRVSDSRYIMQCL